MIIELRGVNFINKGAELMLYAVLQRYKASNNVKVVANLRCGSFKQRTEAGLDNLAWIDIARAPFVSKVIDHFFGLVPQKTRRSFSIFRDNEVDAVLDASGFAFSDQRGIYPSINMAKWTKRWKSQGKKVILLPQAFGPFENKIIRNSVLKIMENADLVFARDKVSYNYLTDIHGASDRLKLAPDFTNLVVGQMPDYWDISKRMVCIIPNYRMIDKTPDNVKASYIPFLEICSRYLLDQGITPFVLIHETNQDYQLAEELQKRLNKELLIIREDNPLYVKGIISSCFAVISSRFHGLVNSLSQGVPCLATGWSHKYQMLLEDYQCPECVVSTPSKSDEIIDKISMIISEPTRTQIINQLQSSGSTLKRLSMDMWTEVEKEIGI